MVTKKLFSDKKSPQRKICLIFDIFTSKHRNWALFDSDTLTPTSTLTNVLHNHIIEIVHCQEIKENELKDTGIVRNVDELGRIVIPMEIRRSFNIGIKDPLEIFVEGDKIILTKHKNLCAFCGCEDNIISFKGKFICNNCKKDINAT
ncbi:AbrB/MazE/SpoVT family DNA-binding domain-containing protein [Candidatus Oleimmundimicrobium sp.]|uniref:AbrB/MazE/SpoVT family DNA-binding domain-containing protein n=1 Tax=Candidatus Oleimmundimicrobium sp. TaxID=3060597 RepID=UPI002715883E|nr:AbrB/MazE/SpoVT family DNA-binding domain-containing protein [Candidatus Oleimmundimicrobium sp.]MDO8886311.1 AbrB/MazE/SpoVT family DNA-binding domain-containing protein [Candidatus Oleimmundimicrobium sp.]